jgi:hypothetical protein
MTTDPLLACPPMIAPRRAPLLGLVLTFTMAGWACSSSGKKDQFYGTDVGADWIPPDATPRDAPGDAAAGDTASDGGDAATDLGSDALDAGVEVGPSADATTGDT